MKNFYNYLFVHKRIYHCIAFLLVISSTMISESVLAAGIKLTRQQVIYLRHAEKFLNSFEFIEGKFEQTNADGSKKNGYYYMRNDGRLRFAYNDPDKTAFVSNGWQVGLIDKYTHKPESPLVPVGLTPLSILTERPADLRKNSTILGAEVKKNFVSFTIAESDKPTEGSMQIFFSRKDFQLLGWILKEPNGTPTAVKIESLVIGKKSDPRLFVINQYQ